MPESVADRIRAEVAGLEVVPMKFRYLHWEHGGRVERLLLKALNARDYHTANAHRAPPPADLDLFQRLADPGTVIVSENFAVLHGVRVGDTIALPGTDGRVRLRVIGTIADFSCSRGTVLVDRLQYRREFGADQADVFSVYVNPADRGAKSAPEAVRKRLQQADWAGELALWVLMRDELRRHILGMVGRFYGVAYVQEAVAVIVAALGVMTTLAISVLKRRRELALSRAVGATRGQVLTLLLAEALLMSVIALVLGGLLGAVIEWYVLRVILFGETGFLFPVRFPSVLAGTLAAVVPLVGPLAGLGPALQAARLRIVQAIAYE
jgi:putative ABC transport system permease protein